MEGIGFFSYICTRKQKHQIFDLLDLTGHCQQALSKTHLRPFIGHTNTNLFILNLFIYAERFENTV